MRSLPAGAVAGTSDPIQGRIPDGRENPRTMRRNDPIDAMRLVDAELATALEAMDLPGPCENTILRFTGDHGEG